MDAGADLDAESGRALVTDDDLSPRSGQRLPITSEVVAAPNPSRMIAA